MLLSDDARVEYDKAQQRADLYKRVIGASTRLEMLIEELSQLGYAVTVTWSANPNAITNESWQAIYAEAKAQTVEALIAQGWNLVLSKPREGE